MFAQPRLTGPDFRSQLNGVFWLSGPCEPTGLQEDVAEIDGLENRREKPLPPLPLNPKRKHHTFDSHQDQCSVELPLQSTGVSEPVLYWPSTSNYRGIDATEPDEDNPTDDRNKPLPLSPIESQSDDTSEPSYEPIDSPSRTTINRNRSLHSNDELPALYFSETPDKLLVAPFTSHPKSRGLDDIYELTESQLLTSFFGFDLMYLPELFNDARVDQVRHYLTTAPHRHTVLQHSAYPIDSCIWLRNFTLNSLLQLQADQLRLRRFKSHYRCEFYFDQGRWRGLMLEDNRTQSVHRGFGLLWDFLDACGPTTSYGSCTEKEIQLQWFERRDIRPSETEHMFQLWNALKLLLVKHSKEHQWQFFRGQDHLQYLDLPRAGRNVVELMRNGLGEIQRYLSAPGTTAQPLWCDSTAGGFFEDACIEWQEAGEIHSSA